MHLNFVISVHALLGVGRSIEKRSIDWWRLFSAFAADDYLV